VSESRPNRYTAAEEIANSITHGLGAALACVGLVVLVVESLRHGSARHVFSALVFGFSLLALYLSSTLYHALSDPASKPLLRRLDHAAIFVLIAGSYTPFTLVTLRGPWGWSIFGVVWTLALIGLFFEDALRRRGVGWSIGLYILMGWVALAAFKPLSLALPWPGIVLLFAGGLAYTLGTVLYAARRIPYHHAWWHIAVLVGSVLHYAAVLLYVIPRG
jgi:hemolysin III